MRSKRNVPFLGAVRVEICAGRIQFSALLISQSRVLKLGSMPLRSEAVALKQSCSLDST